MGPGRLAQLRGQTTGLTLDPNVCVNKVEIVAARRIGGQTPQYVSNIYKYYVAYKLLAEARAEREQAEQGFKGP